MPKKQSISSNSIRFEVGNDRLQYFSKSGYGFGFGYGTCTMSVTVRLQTSVLVSVNNV